MRKTSDVDLSQEVGGRFTLVIAAAKRAKQLNEGARPLVEGNSDNTVAVALEEISSGKVRVIPAGVSEEEAEEQEVGASSNWGLKNFRKKNGGKTGLL